MDLDLKYHLDGEELVDKFRIMTDYHHDSGFISIGNELIEFNFTFSAVDDLIELKEFLKGEGDCFSGGVRVFVNDADSFDPVIAKDSVGLTRQGDCAAAVYNGPEFRLELVLDSAAISTLIPVIETQRFLLLCDSYRLLDEFYTMQETVSKIKGLMESPAPEEETSEIECNHAFELLKTQEVRDVQMRKMWNDEERIQLEILV